jgi:hypothetical protein
MANLVDSKAVFTARARAIGVPDAVLASMLTRGWDTLGAYAFSCTYIPGSSDDTALVQNVLVPLLQRQDHPAAPSLRRLFYESFTMVAADLKHRAERTDTEAPRKLPHPERFARFQRITRKLSNFRIEGPLEPANSLVDLATTMVEEGVLKYVGWEVCISRDQEVLSVKRERSWKPDASGHMVEFAESKLPGADLASDLKLNQALFRRGVAFEMGQLMTYEAHDKIVRLFFHELQREPPPGYKPVSYAQLHRADVEVFRRMAEATRSGLEPDNRGEYPTDKCIDRILGEAGVLMLLQPLMGKPDPVTPDKSGKKAVDDDDDKEKGKKQKKKKSKKDREGKKEVDKADPRGKRVLPKGLKGSSKNDKGVPYCFGYNTEGRGCDKAKDGEKCERGVHSCMVCGGNHPLYKCKKTVS